MEAVGDILTFPRTSLGKGKHRSENAVESLVLRSHVGERIPTYSLASHIPPALFLISMYQSACSCRWLVIQDWQCVLEKQNTKYTDLANIHGQQKKSRAEFGLGSPLLNKLSQLCFRWSCTQLEGLGSECVSFWSLGKFISFVEKIKKLGGF